MFLIKENFYVKWIFGKKLNGCIMFNWLDQLLIVLLQPKINLKKKKKQKKDKLFLSNEFFFF